MGSYCYLVTAEQVGYNGCERSDVGKWAIYWAGSRTIDYGYRSREDAQKRIDGANNG